MDQRYYEVWILRVVLQCTVFVAITRPEEVFNTTPPPLRTNFSCFGRTMGFYADVEADCKVYHTCDDHGNKFTYRCPEETAFRQDALICDHARLVDCHATSYPRKEDEMIIGAPSLVNVPPSVSSPHDRHSFSRSFHVVQRSDKSTTDKTHPSFVFSASVYLRNQNDRNSNRQLPTSSPIHELTTTIRPVETFAEPCCNHTSKFAKTGSNVRNEVFIVSSTPRPFSHNYQSNSYMSTSRVVSYQTHVNASARQELPPKDDRNFNHSTIRSFNAPAISTKKSFDRSEAPLTTTILPITSHTRISTNQFGKSNLHSYNGDYPYLETLRSIQANAKSTISTSTKLPSTTTEIPARALTMSLKPLIPNELEYDPYYPKTPTSTEPYYTSDYPDRDVNALKFTTQATWSSGVHFEIPAVLPDLNTLEDLVDRRKLFYIPRVTAN